jgi:TonB family protein
MKRGFVLAVLLLLSATGFAHAGQPPADPVRVGGPIPAPRKIKDVKPVYPRDAQAARVTGVVILELTIGEDGNVRNAVVLRSVPMLDQAALDCVRQWQFTPTIVSGRTVPVVMTVTVNFAIDGAPAPLPVPPTGPVRLLTFGSQVWEIPLARAATQTRWNLDTGEPLLTLADAKQTARTWLARKNPQLEFEMNSVVLQRIRRGPEVDFWCYQFSYNPTTRQPAMPMLRVVVLPDGSIVEPAQAGGDPAPPLPAGVYRQGPGVTTPRLLHDVKPAYTSDAMRARISGSVLVECVVGTDGVPRDCRIARSPDPTFGLDQEALKAATQWRFEPGTKDGRPVPVMVTIEHTFVLGK